MSTDHMTQFVEGLHASRLLDGNRIEELMRRPESPQGDVDGVARFLESNGWLNRFQIDEIRQGRGQYLSFAGYQLMDRLPDAVGGQAFRALHPTSRQNVVVRFIDPNWPLPNDDIRSYLDRARGVGQQVHPNLINIFDAGQYGETAYVVHEYVEGADLGFFVNEMGALPVTLACDYVRQAAIGLQSCHERGIFHGDISPARLVLSPVIRKTGVNGTGQTISTRPAPGATIKLAEMGLIPHRPAANQVSFTQSNLLGSVHFLAPERLSTPGPDMRGDLYSLGATLYYLLGARPPFPAASTVDALLQLQQAVPSRIDSLRKDVNPALADLIHRLMSKDPAARPSSAASVVQYLQPFTQANAIPVAAAVADPIVEAMPVAYAPEVMPMAEAVYEPTIEHLPEGTSDSQVYGPRSGTQVGFGGGDQMFADHGETHDEPRVSRRAKPEASENAWLWIILAIVLHVGAIGFLIAYLTGVIKI
ncbi:MAG: serine/threonine protein kinase [Planctomycetes bacterium]|nr:serine/threonine protein kinase [Planctomycetota bacterium]